MLPLKPCAQIAKELSREEYYHGLLPREDIESLLRRNGDFLIRYSEARKGQEKSFILSTMVKDTLEKDGIKHFIISKTPQGKFAIELFGFPTIPEMVAYYLQGKPVTKDGQVMITTPIKRQCWEHAHENIVLGKRLGEGAFGEVSLGTLKLARRKQQDKSKLKIKTANDGYEVAVAIKVAKMEALTKEQIKEIMSEARLMRRFDHPNIVKFYGVATLQEPLMVLMELCSDGALDSYLRKRTPPFNKLDEMVMQAAWGLEFIHRHNVIHRDIAARNCLYGKGNVKIADFGLSREGTCYRMEPHSRVPIRWLSPECINTSMFTQKTDVWAFGIMAWEVYHEGKEPYPEMTIPEVAGKIRENFRMSFRDGVKRDVADFITRKVWNGNAHDRPDMQTVVAELQKHFNMHFGSKKL